MSDLDRDQLARKLDQALAERDQALRELSQLRQQIVAAGTSGDRHEQPLTAGHPLLGTNNQRSDELFRVMVESVVDYAIFMLDANGRIVTWNKGAERIKGYQDAEILGKPYALFFSPEDVQAGKPQRLLAQARQFGRVEDLGWRVRKDGTRFWADAVITALIDAQGNLTGYAKVTRDLTEFEHLEREKIEALQQADILKDQFISILSHELRTPINSITGFGSILDDEVVGPLTEKQHEYLRKILSGADTLLGLVNDLLDLSRIQAGRFHLSPQPFDFALVAADALSSLQALAEPKHMHLLNEVPQGLPPLVGDAQRIRQVLLNLVNNAIKFTPDEGTIRVRACLDGAVLRCEVQDTGIGIATEDIPKLFKPFSQVDMSSTRPAGGTGLGLMISKSLVEAHGGQIGVESQPGAGSTFWFTLPLDPAFSQKPAQP
ncbi:Non-motile and phage-resistance protein [compost metagenome]